MQRYISRNEIKKKHIVALYFGTSQLGDILLSDD